MSAYERYSKQEFARRGDELYERTVRPQLGSDAEGRFVAIDIESGEFDLGDSELAAMDRLVERRPDAAVWLVRVGSRYVHRFGGLRTTAA